MGVPITFVNDNYVTIKWVEPYSGGAGVQITAYEVLIKTKFGNFVPSAECDGSLPETVANQ